MNYSNDTKLLSISQAAKKLSIRKATFLTYLEEGQIGYIKQGKRKKIPVSELVQFIQHNIVRNPSSHNSNLINLTPSKIKSSKKSNSITEEDLIIKKFKEGK